MIKRKSWEEFRSHGLLLIINQTLHIFGWAIVFVCHGDKVVDVYPARVKFRGFSNEDVSEAYTNVTSFMNSCAAELYAEVNEKDEDYVPDKPIQT